MTRRNVTTLREDFICWNGRDGILKASFFARQPEEYALVIMPMGFGSFE